MTSKASKKTKPDTITSLKKRKKLWKDCVDLLDRISWQWDGIYLPWINIFMSVFQLHDQHFNWKVDNRTIWVLAKYLKLEVENGGTMCLSYEQQGCIVYNLGTLLITFCYSKSINSISCLIWNQKSACWEVVERLSLSSKQYTCIAKRIFHFKNCFVTAVQEVLKMEWHIWACMRKLYIWEKKNECLVQTEELEKVLKTDF